MNTYVPVNSPGSADDEEYQSKHGLRSALNFWNLKRPTASVVNSYNNSVAIGKLGAGITAVGLGVGGLMFADKVIKASGGLGTFFEKPTKIGNIPVGFPEMKAKFSTPLTAALLAGAGVFGLASSMLSDSKNKSKWSLSRDPYNGNLQIENPNFMGANGSLAMSLSRNRGNSLNHMLAAQQAANNEHYDALRNPHVVPELAETTAKFLIR